MSERGKLPLLHQPLSTATPLHTEEACGIRLMHAPASTCNTSHMARAAIASHCTASYLIAHNTLRIVGVVSLPCTYHRKILQQLQCGLPVSANYGDSIHMFNRQRSLLNPARRSLQQLTRRHLLAQRARAASAQSCCMHRSSRRLVGAYL